MNKSFIILLIASILISGLALAMSFNTQGSEIAVIDSNRLLENYDGFKEAQDIYEKDMEAFNISFKMQSELFEAKNQEYQQHNSLWTEQVKNEKVQELKKIESSLTNLKSAIELKSKEKEQLLLEGIYNKVDDFIKRYSKDNNYKLVVGASGNGNVVFNTPDIDKTDEIIELLNEEFHNGTR